MNNKFTKWFLKAYKQWCKKEVGEEDFIGFCFHLGYPPYKVLDWQNGNAVPSGSEVLSIADLLGIEVYTVLGLEKPDQELLDIFDKFSHFKGELRGNLSQALYEANLEIESNNLSNDTEGMKAIVQKTMKKWGFP